MNCVWQSELLPSKWRRKNQLMTGLFLFSFSKLEYNFNINVNINFFNFLTGIKSSATLLTYKPLNHFPTVFFPSESSVALCSLSLSEGDILYHKPSAHKPFLRQWKFPNPCWELHWANSPPSSCPALHSAVLCSQSHTALPFQPEHFSLSLIPIVALAGADTNSPKFCIFSHIFSCCAKLLWI